MTTFPASTLISPIRRKCCQFLKIRRISPINPFIASNPFPSGGHQHVNLRSEILLAGSMNINKPTLYFYFYHIQNFHLRRRRFDHCRSFVI